MRERQLKKDKMRERQLLKKNITRTGSTKSLNA